MQHVVSYEHKKSGSRTYNDPAQTYQEGLYKGTKGHIDSYAAYRAPPPAVKTRGPRSSNEATLRLWDDGRQPQYPTRTDTMTSDQRVRRGSIERETHINYQQGREDPRNLYNNFDPAYPMQHPYQQYQPTSTLYPNPAVISTPSLGTLSPGGDIEYLSQNHQDLQPIQPHIKHLQYDRTENIHHLYTNSPPQISIQSAQNYEVHTQPLTSKSQSGQRSPLPFVQYALNAPQQLPQRMMPVNGTTVSNLIIPTYTDERVPPRRSTDSIRERSKTSLTHERIRSCSFSFSFSEASSSANSDISSPSSPSSTIGKQHAPIVYPALLSLVAEAFRSRVNLSNRTKDNIEYKDCFDGRDAVDKIAFIIKTTDRNLALLLGRALDTQKFFHDVTYDHRLRDSPNELYHFQKMPSILPSDNYDAEEEIPEEPDLPSGVFTLLTDCYSPTCTRDNLCYSIACPRRLEQNARKNMKPNSNLKRANSRGSITEKRDQKLWIHTVPPEIAESVSETEKKRQEAINEVIYTEDDFVRDLEYVRDCWMIPILSQNIIPDSRRESFVKDVFGNILEILSVNSKLADALEKRQSSYAIVGQIGDIFLEYVPMFKPFIQYGSHQLWGKYEFEKEKNSNPAFAKFVDETERLPESRKLELNGYLTKPTTRLGRYPLLLEAVLKQTPEGNPDQKNLPVVVKIIREFLASVNTESGKSENRFNLQQLQDQLIPKGNEIMDLRLTEEDRQIIFKGSLKKRSKRSGTGESSDLHVFLFDHALLMVKAKTINKMEQYKIRRKPIPLELLSVSTSEGPTEGARVNTKNTKSPKRPHSMLPGPAVRGSNEKQFAITFTYLGKKGFSKSLLLEKNKFSGTNKVVCAAYFDNYRRLAFGTDTGVYVLEVGQSQKSATRVLQIERVSQIEILEDFRLLLILADKNLYTCPIDALDPDNDNPTNKRPKKISSHASFFKSGTSLGKTLVTVVKNSTLTSIIKTLEPLEQTTKSKNKGSTLKGLLRGGSESLKTYKEFSIPAELISVHFLNRQLCVGCNSKGFEIVDLVTLNAQCFLHPDDASHDFVTKKENVKSIAMYRTGSGDFLLCYDEFAFFVNKHGRRIRPDWIIYWEGTPTSFALRYPYILAFEPSFVEIRHIETGSLEQIIEGNHIRCLYSDARGNIVFSTNDLATDSSEVFFLNFKGETSETSIHSDTTFDDERIDM
ncbi:6433_t:CDS:10 [Acaulospora morrowiae]|uniref:6433_t:CDS:1 n=1 Tax=Acaulospora morrowiae TaxID=94023 RepID=A0A9N8V5K2_9GLOM|nr:6433_t:CDS:10 [Acaulospora morrowiae]